LLAPQNDLASSTFASQPSQLCVPVAMNAVDYPVPSFILPLAQALAFECSTLQPNPPLQVSNLVLTHLNPVLIDLGIPSETVNVTQPRSLCVPVRQNNQSISAAVLNIVDGVVLKKYDTVDSSGQSTPPVSASLTLTHMAVAGAPDFHVDTLTPQQLMLPVRDRGAAVPAMRGLGNYRVVRPHPGHRAGPDSPRGDVELALTGVGDVPLAAPGVSRPLRSKVQRRGAESQ
jgi:hypothetical protein